MATIYNRKFAKGDEPVAPCGCDWADRPNHDRLVRIEGDLTALEAFIQDLCLYAQSPEKSYDFVPPFELAEFMSQHTWDDPVTVYLVVHGLMTLARQAREAQIFSERRGVRLEDKVVDLELQVELLRGIIEFKQEQHGD